MSLNLGSGDISFSPDYAKLLLLLDKPMLISRPQILPYIKLGRVGGVEVVRLIIVFSSFSFYYPLSLSNFTDIKRKRKKPLYEYKVLVIIH